VHLISMQIYNAHAIAFVASFAPFIKIVATDVAFVQGHLMNGMTFIRFVEAFVTFSECFLMNNETFLGIGVTSPI
jgi:hypothetical protein